MTTESSAHRMATFMVGQIRRVKEEIESYKKEPSKEKMNGLATRGYLLEKFGYFLENNTPLQLLIVASPAVMDLDDMELQIMVFKWLNDTEYMVHLMADTLNQDSDDESDW